MNRRKLFSIAAAMSAVFAVPSALTGCGIYGIGNPGVEEVVGRWVETTPDVKTEQGYVFRSDGTVSSFGMGAREARSYKADRGLMEMKGVVHAKDGSELGFTHSYIIEKPTDDAMVLKQGYERRTFRRAE